jgi:hypothetical protein
MCECAFVHLGEAQNQLGQVVGRRGGDEEVAVEQQFAEDWLLVSGVLLLLAGCRRVNGTLRGIGPVRRDQLSRL